jgi:AbrB family looped-hinge helix DNA binding protein
METTTLSTKGQIILPKNIRDSRAWRSGTKFTVEETHDGILLRPMSRLPRTKLEDVAGSLKSNGRAKTLAEMDEGIAREVSRRNARGRR